MNNYFKTGLITICALVLIVGSAIAGKQQVGSGGWLGVYMQSVDYDLAEAFELPINYGVIVNRVMDDSPAEEAGLKEEELFLTS